ncbi:carbohydrate kinase [Alicyclobacillus sp. SO9]|uniref:carbohydrate kinase family protein n=1 Tax=Alicyclobacillus sp. SO9 TaxID=2665646 RepID=UPI0018E89F69|nr:carbohydrate kinase [Alicyclobacillus sp. SO9]QQE80359.1 carbohydrate kinase [Alicyclobacillus sp. SO9]
MRTVVSMGESLIDFVAHERGRLRNVTTFTKAAGGAPANVAACVGKLGGRSAFIGRRSEDEFGQFLQHTLEEFGVNVQYFLPVAQRPTAMAFVALDETGDRSFQFFLENTAYQSLEPSDIPIDFLESAGILHVGSVAMATEPGRTTTLHAVKQMKQLGGVVSFDPNWRPNLWPDPTQGAQVIESVYPFTDVLKVNREELELLTGTSDLSAGAQRLHSKGPGLVLITLDADGCFYSLQSASSNRDFFGSTSSETSTGGTSSMTSTSSKSGTGSTASPLSQGQVPGRRVNVADTTGAGDAFIASFLFQLAQSPNARELSEQSVRNWVEFAVAASSLVTTKPGAMAALPTLREVESVLESAL